MTRVRQPHEQASTLGAAWARHTTRYRSVDPHDCHTSGVATCSAARPSVDSADNGVLLPHWFGLPVSDALRRSPAEGISCALRCIQSEAKSALKRPAGDKKNFVSFQSRGRGRSERKRSKSGPREKGREVGPRDSGTIRISKTPPLHALLPAVMLGLRPDKFRATSEPGSRVVREKKVKEWSEESGNIFISKPATCTPTCDYTSA